MTDSGARLADIRAAATRVETAKARGLAHEAETAVKELQAAVDDARAENVAWGAIGEVLGITRGNAYQRYRHRPER
jgi:hypothetical protein